VSDLAFLAIIPAFFLLAGLFVQVCDRILGPDEAPVASPRVEPDQGQVAA
jgi:hypothetical protein